MVFCETFVLPSFDYGHVTEKYGNNCVIIQIKFTAWYTETPCNYIRDQVDQKYTSSVILTDFPVRFVLCLHLNMVMNIEVSYKTGRLMTS
jgi:hypothetical protein